MISREGVLRLEKMYIRSMQLAWNAYKRAKIRAGKAYLIGMRELDKRRKL